MPPAAMTPVLSLLPVLPVSTVAGSPVLTRPVPSSGEAVASVPGALGSGIVPGLPDSVRPPCSVESVPAKAGTLSGS